jgi:hypothetical protein
MWRLGRLRLQADHALDNSADRDPVPAELWPP